MGAARTAGELPVAAHNPEAADTHRDTLRLGIPVVAAHNPEAAEDTRRRTHLGVADTPLRVARAEVQAEGDSPDVAADSRKAEMALPVPGAADSWVAPT